MFFVSPVLFFAGGAGVSPLCKFIFQCEGGRTIWAIGKQLECGIFKPDAYEMKFLLDGEVVESKKTLSMKGKIDRIDICEDDNNIYVRIVDYKSGKSDFDL